jgi:hypothetical protein
MLRIITIILFILCVYSDTWSQEQKQDSTRTIYIKYDDLKNQPDNKPINLNDIENVKTKKYKDLVGQNNEIDSQCSGTMSCCITCLTPEKVKYCVIEIPNTCTCLFDPGPPACLTIDCSGSGCPSYILCCGTIHW